VEVRRYDSCVAPGPDFLQAKTSVRVYRVGQGTSTTRAFGTGSQRNLGAGLPGAGLQVSLNVGAAAGGAAAGLQVSLNVGAGLSVWGGQGLVAFGV